MVLFLYMDELIKMLERFIALDENQVLFKTMSDNPFLEKVVQRLNTKDQLDKGQLADGSFLPYYSLTYQKVYGKPNTRIKLFDTGEFWNSIEIVLDLDGFRIVGDGQKEDTNLFERYGQEILGLTEQNLDRFIDELKPKVVDAIRKSILQ